MHDMTHFRVLQDGALAYRKELPDKATLDPPGLRALLMGMGIPAIYRDCNGREQPLIPSNGALEKWLNSDGPEPLRLLNGTAVKAFWEKGGKGSLKNDPAGFHGAWNAEGRLMGVKAVLGRWEALELWRGWNEKKKRWEYYKRLIPARGVFKALRSLGYSWKKKTKRPWRDGAPELTKPLKHELGGPVPPFAHRAVHPVTKKPVVFRTGDTFRIALTREGKPAIRGVSAIAFGWVSVKAVMAGKMTRNGPGRIELLSMFTKGMEPGAPSDADDLAFLAGLPPADDSSSYPTQRPPGPSRPGGEAPFGLE